LVASEALVAVLLLGDEGERCPPATFCAVRSTSFNAGGSAFHRALRRPFT